MSDSETSSDEVINVKYIEKDPNTIINKKYTDKKSTLNTKLEFKGKITSDQLNVGEIIVARVEGAKLAFYLAMISQLVSNKKVQVLWLKPKSNLNVLEWCFDKKQDIISLDSIWEVVPADQFTLCEGFWRLNKSYVTELQAFITQYTKPVVNLTRTTGTVDIINAIDKLEKEAKTQQDKRKKTEKSNMVTRSKKIKV